MLPFFGILLFALMGIAALVVDAGTAFSSQAELEATGRTLALEYARYLDDRAADPALGPEEWDGRLQDLQTALLGPGAPDATWSLPEEAERPDLVGYERRVPLRFGFAALLPAALGPDGRVRDGLSVRELLAARAAGGPDALPASGGLRARGFQSRTALLLRHRPAVRVGPVIPAAPERPVRVPGLARIALVGSVLDEDGRLPVPLGPLERSGAELLLSGGTTCVGVMIDASAGASVGEPPALDTSASTGWTLDERQAYVPLLVAENCEDALSEPSTARVRAFFNLRRDADLDSLEVSGVRSARNASARPAPGKNGLVDSLLGCGRDELLCLSTLEAP